MIKNGNLLDQIGKDNNVILHGCNAQGVWGSGVAAQLKNVHPASYKQYLEDLYKFSSAEATIGQCSYYITRNAEIISGITQLNYGRDGSRYVSYDALSEVFDGALKYCQDLEKSLHLPNLIGAGLGGGDYDVILEILNSEMRHYNVDVTIWNYER